VFVCVCVHVCVCVRLCVCVCALVRVVCFFLCTLLEQGHDCLLVVLLGPVEGRLTLLWGVVTNSDCMLSRKMHVARGDAYGDDGGNVW
jgi:hypothetical protein